MGSFGLEHLPDRLIAQLRMLVGLGVGNALVEQHAIQLFQALDPQGRREEPLAHQADLVLRKNKLSNTVFDGYDDIVDKACQAWLFFADDKTTATTITAREWATVSS